MKLDSGLDAEGSRGMVGCGIGLDEMRMRSLVEIRKGSVSYGYVALMGWTNSPRWQ